MKVKFFCPCTRRNNKVIAPIQEDDFIESDEVKDASSVVGDEEDQVVASSASADGEANDFDYSKLSPKEAFEKFDTNNSGDIDMDEFFHLLEVVGITTKEESQERLFRKYAKEVVEEEGASATLTASSRTVAIDYNGFKSAWLLLGDPKRELLDRGVTDIPKFATHYQLVRLLEKTIDDADRTYSLAKAEADRYRTIQDTIADRKLYIQKAKDRAGLELARALDAAGCVFVLGTGAYNQYKCGMPKKDMSTTTYPFEGMELIQSLWEDRVAVRMGNMSVNTNTAGVWGRRPRRVAMTDNTIFALTDSGLLSWGGTSNWNIQSVIQTTSTQIVSGPVTQTTPRSSVLLMNSSHTHGKHNAAMQEEVDEVNAQRAVELMKLRVVLKYYSCWPAHFDRNTDLKSIRDHLIANVEKDTLIESLLLRGKRLEKGLSQLEMASILANDICLEREILGERGHQSFCNMEREIIDLMKRKDIKQADYLRLKFIEKWMPLSKEQNTRAIVDDQRKEVERMSHYDQQEKAYEQWNAKRSSLERAPIDEHNGLLAGSITTRGSDLQTPRGQSQFLDLSAGANHASIIVQDEKTQVGKLYTWGVGSLGRLGHGESAEDWSYPKLVEALKGSSIKEISCGYSHSAAITTSGELFVWGDGSCGKLGFGNELTDFFCPIPSRLLSHITVVKVSCGAMHTACIGLSGELYVWGACDSGRLGLGPDRSGIQFSPTLVNPLRHERIAEVSCGTSTTLALSISEKVGTRSRTSVERMTGGRLYVAGPKNVLGASFPSFGELEYLKENLMVIKSVAAGSSHQVFISQSGELYCWGQNKHGCCGQPETTTFLQKPTLVERLYKAPRNLALGKPCHMSTLFNDSTGLSAKNAVDGNINGNDVSLLAHTQFEEHPYFQLDLEFLACITNIRLWNRTDASDDMSLPVDYYSRRLFPCVIMISKQPFRTDLRGKDGLAASISQSVAYVRFTEDTQMSNWDVPKFTEGRYVRLQSESSTFLHFAQIEVFGHDDMSHAYTSISSCSAGKFVTAVVIDGMDRNGMESAFKRAISADWYNAEILRQFSTYIDQYSKEDYSLFNKDARCLLCDCNKECDICTLKSRFRDNVQHNVDGNHPYRLRDLEALLLSTKNVECSNNN